MGLGTRYFLLILFLAWLFVTGTLIFIKGFLLKRNVVPENSSCVVDFTVQSDRHGEEGCWMHKRYSRAIVIIIDALRYDFLLFNSSAINKEEKHSVPYQNKLTIVEQLLRSKPLHSRLYKFLADPPTTTLQRIKGLTTGSLPTFVDAGSNFASVEITEDNFVDQLQNLGKRIKFMGDDTWMGLFPNRFFRSYPFPSFDVLDLHTVDNGVKKHLVPEMRKNDWDFLIAHFLGVDHCGHRFGPNHPAMAVKLEEMDQVLRSVVKEMREDSVLMVLGDHGMTRTGDHGGDSRDEVEAGLFIYSPAQITSTPLPTDPSQYKTVSQIDLVPTISLLLGAPIPFSNLGMVMTDLFNHCPWWKTGNSKVKQIYHSLKALRLNAYQINGYLEAYKKMSEEFPKNEFEELQKLFRHAEFDLQNLLTAMVKYKEDRDIEKKMSRLEEHYITYISGVKAMCQEIWAKFDVPSIVLGLAIVLMSLSCTLFILLTEQGWRYGVISWSTYSAVGACTLLSLFGIIQHVYLPDVSSASMPIIFGAIDLVVFVLLFVAVVHISQKRSDKEKIVPDKDKPVEAASLIPALETIVAIGICIIIFVSYFSNSFVVFEDSVTSFCAQTVVVVIASKAIQNILRKELLAASEHKIKSDRQKKGVRFDIMRIFTHPACVVAEVTLIILTFVRISAYFRACREEQWTCEINTSFLSPLSESSHRNIRYCLSVLCLTTIIISSRQWLKHLGNMNGLSAPVLCAKYALPASAICLALHWALQGLPVKLLDSLPTWQRVSFARAVYVLLFLSLLALQLKPLCIYVLEQVQDKEFPINLPGLPKGQIIPSVFNHVKLNWRVSSPDNTEKLPVVYGLGSVYSASIVYLVIIFTFLVAMLLGDGMAPSVCLLFLVQFLYLELSAIYHGNHSQDMSGVKFLPILGWCLLSSVYFYNTAHQTTVTTIRWESAFVGFSGNYDYNLIPACLIGLNTFGSYVMFTIASPLLLFSQRVCGKMIMALGKRTESTAVTVDKGDFVYHEEAAALRSHTFRFILGIFFIQGLKLFGAMVAAALHRRHLMVWKIFAPRFIFEAATSCIVFGTCILMYLFILRLDHALEKWLKTLAAPKSSKLS